MAECFWPGVTEQELVELGARARPAARATGSGDRFARYLGSILVPSDEIALCLFEAASLDAVTEVNRRAAVPFERILEIVRLGAVAPKRPRQLDSSTTRQRSLDEPSQ
jgi:hypothetical protein